jgi:hypothetical protein
MIALGARAVLITCDRHLPPVPPVPVRRRLSAGRIGASRWAGRFVVPAELRFVRFGGVGGRQGFRAVHFVEVVFVDVGGRGTTRVAK